MITVCFGWTEDLRSDPTVERIAASIGNFDSTPIAHKNIHTYRSFDQESKDRVINIRRRRSSVTISSVPSSHAVLLAMGVNGSFERANGIEWTFKPVACGIRKVRIS